MTQGSPPFVFATTNRGHIKGASIIGSDGTLKCYRFGRVPYAQTLISDQRWKRAKGLPKGFRYGTKDSPTDFTNPSPACPQPGSRAAAVDEDCLYCNIWLPSTKKPRKGWPVFVYIHGGFLQWGSSNWENPAELLKNIVDCVVVAPTYRLNVFGFLASHELLQDSTGDGGYVGNLGFWDQRTAIEWTFSNIDEFGGNKQNITLGGLSAGAYSTFHQLAHELALPDSQAIIRRVVMWSNGVGLRPKSLSEYQDHFNMLLSVLKIPQNASATDKVRKLRALPWQELLAATEKMPENSFRAVSDGHFVRHSLFHEIEDGTFARAMLRRGIKILVGDVRDEVNSYRLISPPSSYETLVSRLAVEYPDAASKRLAKLYCPSKKLAVGDTWQNLFGRVYADMQVHVSERGFLTALSRSLPLSSIFRYRINWRTESCDQSYAPGMGIAHASDLSIWFFGNGRAVQPAEDITIRDFLRPFAQYLQGEEVDWGVSSIKQTRAILSDGTIQIVDDQDWDRSQETWKKLQPFVSSQL